MAETSNLQLIEQIRRAHSSAQPRPSENPAWANCHFDCGILLAEINRLERENRELREGGAALLTTRTRIEDRYRAALENVRSVKLLTDCGINPLRAAGIRHALEITREIAAKALESSAPETAADDPDTRAIDDARLYGSGFVMYTRDVVKHYIPAEAVILDRAKLRPMTDYTKVPEVMNPPESAAKGSEAGNLTRANVMGLEEVHRAAEARPANVAPLPHNESVLVKNGYCTDCGGINEHYEHCLTKRAARSVAVPPVETPALPLVDGEKCSHPVLHDNPEQPGVDVYVCAQCHSILDLYSYRVRRTPETAARCINYPCCLPNGHTGPCSSSSEKTSGDQP